MEQEQVLLAQALPSNMTKVLNDEQKFTKTNREHTLEKEMKESTTTV